MGIDASGGVLAPGDPVLQIETAYAAASPSRRYDIAADGRLLVIRNDRGAPPLNRDEVFPARIQLIQGWNRDLEEALR